MVCPCFGRIAIIRDSHQLPPGVVSQDRVLVSGVPSWKQTQVDEDRYAFVKIHLVDGSCPEGIRRSRCWRRESFVEREP